MEHFSWLMMDVGGPNPLWVLLLLGKWAWGVSNVPLWSLQHLPSGSCFKILLDFPPWWIVICKLKWIFSSSRCFWSWCSSQPKGNRIEQSCSYLNATPWFILCLHHVAGILTKNLALFLKVGIINLPLALFQKLILSLGTLSIINIEDQFVALYNYASGLLIGYYPIWRPIFILAR